MYLGAGTTRVTAALSLPTFKDSPLHDGSDSMPQSVLKFGHDLFSREQIQASPDTFHCERYRIAQGRAAPAHTSPHSSSCRTETEQPSCSSSAPHPALANLPRPPCSHPLSPSWAEEANPLPYSRNNEVVGSHDKDLASSRAALHGEVRHTEIRREGLGVINQLAQGISF